jgi:hypothetical protein
MSIKEEGEPRQDMDLVDMMIHLPPKLEPLDTNEQDLPPQPIPEPVEDAPPVAPPMSAPPDPISEPEPSAAYPQNPIRSNQSLDEILEKFKKTVDTLKPWKNSRPEIYRTYDFLKDIRKDSILSLMNIVDQLSPSKILEKAHEIECLAIRLDMDHS